MTVCELCSLGIALGEDENIQTSKILSAIRMGYDPFGEVQAERPIEELRDGLQVLLEMHDPSWIVCSSCLDVLNSRAEGEIKSGPRPPEAIHIFGNGFLPKPWQWRVLIGAWVDKWSKKGIEMTLTGTPICMNEYPKASLMDFLEMIPRQSEQFREHMVDELICQDHERGLETALLAVWSVEDSPVMRRMLHDSQSALGPTSERHVPTEGPGNLEEQEEAPSQLRESRMHEEVPTRPIGSDSQQQSTFASEAEIWQPGHILHDRYYVCALKRSSMGVIYFCKYFSDTVERFVIKTLPKRLVVEHRELFLQEVAAWVQLNTHPHIVAAFGAQEIEERPCLLLEYVAGDVQHGRDLSGWIGTPELDLRRALMFAWQICAGLSYAAGKFHTAGKMFVHRDLKPTNLFVVSPEQVKISDFGIALIYDLKNGEPVGDQFLGSRVYKSPEQCRGEVQLDLRSDIYSFGCVLYEMLTGKTVFDLPRTSSRFIEAHLHEMPQNPKQFNTGIPLALNTLVMKCLEKNKETRYLDFAILQKELGEIYEDLFSMHPPSPPVGHIDEIGARLAQATADILLGKPGEALQQFGNLKNSAQTRMAAGQIVVKAEAMGKAGQLNEALRFLKEMLKGQEREPEIWNQRGRLLSDLGRYEEALDCFDHALNLDGHNASFFNNKAHALLALGRSEEAMTCIETCLILNPRLAAAWNNKGRACADLGKWEQASNCYEKSIDLNSAEAEVWFNWSVAAGSLKQTDKARARLRRCLVIDPNHWKALHNLVFFWKENQAMEEDRLAIDEAIANEKIFVREHPENRDFLAQLVATLVALNRKPEVLDILADFLSQNR